MMSPQNVPTCRSFFTSSGAVMVPPVRLQAQRPMRQPAFEEDTQYILWGGEINEKRLHSTAEQVGPWSASQ